MMPENFSASDITFKEMSEDEAVKEFQKDGYFEYAKRRMRYRSIPSESVWATAPARMFVAYYEEKPVGVIGFARHKNVLLGAGIHVREEYRGRGLTSILIDKLLSEKGSTTLYINIMNPRVSSSYRKKGFVDMQEERLPQDAREAIEGIGFQDQVQKWMVNSSGSWFDELKKEKDACYHKVRSRYKKWPSAYASGALVQCRKVGAKNWGNSVKKSADDIRLALTGRIVRLYLSKPIRTLNQFRKRIGNAPEGARKHLQENAKAQEEKINDIQNKYKTELEQANDLERLLIREGKKLPEGVIRIAAEQIEHFGLDALEEEVDYIIQRRLK